MLPEWFFVLVASLFGLVIGSFLNVVIYRLHTGRSLNDRSHCLSCAKPLNWYELFPVLSYLFLRGRCRSCGAYIPYRYVLVELLTAAAFALAYVSTEGLFELITLCGLLSLLIIGAVYDFYHMIIPDEISGGVAMLAWLLLFWAAFPGSEWGVLIGGGVAAALTFLFFASLWYISGGRALGFGDAKLSIGLGALVGLGGVFSLLVLSFWVGAIISVGLMIGYHLAHRARRVAGTRRVKMKSEVPFAPFLIIAFILVYFFEADVLAWGESVFRLFI